MNTVITVSVLVGFATYTAFLIFCIANWRRGVTGQALLLAGLLTLLWMASPLTDVSRPFYPVFEPIAVAAWTILLVRALGLSFERNQPADIRPVIWTFLSSMGLAAIAALVSTAVAFGWLIDASLVLHLTMLVVNVLGLVLVEQLAQNSVTDLRWRVRYLNIGLGMMFVFGVVHHALAILMQNPVTILAALQPAVMALMAPFVVIASLRNRANKLRFSLSHNFVFRTGVLVSTGTFLLLLGLFGYLAQIFAGDVGVTVAVFISIVAVAFFLIVVGSSRFRSQLRVQLSKTFFEYRYDYRDEWMKVTAQLTEPDADFDLPQQAQRAIKAILHAKNSALLVRNTAGNFVPISHIEAAEWFDPLPPALASAIDEFYRDHDWVLDLRDMPEDAAGIDQLVTSTMPSKMPGYLIPLFIESELFGICLVGPSEIPVRLLWEDYDIIKLISKQCAGFLALQGANRLLIEQEQMSAVHQMSAFLLHDIKTIAAQLSLILDNAPKHRSNPAFIDDMLSTTKNSVRRMERIIARLREPEDVQQFNLVDVDLGELLRQRHSASLALNTRIKYDPGAGAPVARVDREALTTALTHLEQNALEAVGETGSVCVSLDQRDDWALLHIRDDGPGMSEAFVKNELFTPFRSSKGLSGLGIGAYQARDKIRSCGGDLQVESKAGVGTTFTIKLPLVVVKLEA